MVEGARELSGTFQRYLLVQFLDRWLVELRARACVRMYVRISKQTRYRQLCHDSTINAKPHVLRTYVRAQAFRLVAYYD